MRKIGVMVGGAEDEPRAQADVATFRQTLQTGWTVSRNADRSPLGHLQCRAPAAAEGGQAET